MRQVMKVFPQLSNYPGLTLKATVNTIICFGWKLFGKDQQAVSCVNAWDYASWAYDINDDRAVCLAAYDILKDADAVITHNGRRFDWKFLQTRLLFHGIPPLPKINHIDTCVLAKSNLFLFNNKLNTVAKFLTEEEKIDNGGWDLWVRVSQRENEACRLMSEYCQQDVITLEAVFRELRPFAVNLPNHGLFTEGAKRVCPSCGSSRHVKYGTRHTKAARYQRFMCTDCRSCFNAPFVREEDESETPLP